jgi:hypothetical protein
MYHGVHAFGLAELLKSGDYITNVMPIYELYARHTLTSYIYL